MTLVVLFHPVRYRQFKLLYEGFFGFKLHVIINHLGELLRIQLAPGHVDDRKPIPDLCTSLFGKLYARKGYLAK
jgi:hypothetical protein